MSLTRSPRQAPVAVGGTLDPATLIGAYRAGAFPWPIDEEGDEKGDEGDDGEPVPDGGGLGLCRILRAAVSARRIPHLSPHRPGGYDLPWWSPDPRAVIPVGGVRVSRSLRKRLRDSGWTTTVDECFVDVVHRCRRRDSPGWITPELIEGYASLHALGWAHSVEVWDGADLVGGAYGVGVGGVFAGESMFHVRTDASKVALVDLEARFAEAGGMLIDVQIASEHMTSLGAREIPRDDFLAILVRTRDAEVRLVRDRLPVRRLAPT